jgi:hypothetical protein
MRVIGFLHVLKIDQVTFRFVYVYIVELVVLNMHDIFTAGRSAIKNQYIYSISFVPGITTRELYFERVESFLNLERRLLSKAFFRSEKKVDYGRFHTSKRICRLLCDLCKAESRRLGTLCIQQCHETNRMDGAISICRTRVSV